MALMEWDDSYSVKVAEIDKQHQTLIQMLNTLNDAMKERKAKEVLGEIINGLIDYAGTHFAKEEKYFDQFSFTGSFTHKNEHQEFVKQVLKFKQGFDAGQLMVSIDVMDFDQLISLAKQKDVGLTVVGPENPLCAGIVDAFEAEGLRVFGPSAEAARLEGSKIFAKEMMVKYDIPTGQYREFDQADEAVDYVREAGAPIVVKASGNAMGKGVSVCRTVDEAEQFIKETGCDSLAVAIGTSHGAYKFKHAPKLAFDRIDEIAQKVPGTPLVMHGSSSVPAEFIAAINKYAVLDQNNAELCRTAGETNWEQMPQTMGVPEEAIARAAKMAICKVNIDTDLRLAMTSAILKVWGESNDALWAWIQAGSEGERPKFPFDPREYFGPGREAVKATVASKMKALGCAGKAKAVMG